MGDKHIYLTGDAGNDYENRLCEILGIDPQLTARIMIDIKPSSPIEITIVQFASVKRVDDLLSLFGEMKLSENKA